MTRIRALICRWFGHRIEETPLRRGKLRGVAVGCRRCDTMFDVKTDALPRMTVPRG